MDGVSGVSGASTLDVAAAGTSSVAAYVLTSTEALLADEAQRLFASIGVGTNFSAFA
ncbi:MAG: hypothetical protein JO103_07615 [Candidatus Eremiobacteraeota bacterium]|nr:hypothetical protein [Candidatus Eremiobacteraeota bacterium]MBV9408867.1 hypothetical protein [Candidatus Eremiobacteraeota bacterium]